MGEGPRFGLPDEKWQELKAQYGLTDRHVVDMFMRPFLVEIAQRGAIRFASDPRVRPEASMLGEQWRILRDEMGFVYDPRRGEAVPLSVMVEQS